MVSTDSEEIAEIAEKFGARVPFLRSAENSVHYAGQPCLMDEIHKIANEYKHTVIEHPMLLALSSKERK